MKNTKNAKLNVAELIKEREKLLEKKPELKTAQRQIDGKLSKAGRDPNERAKLMFEHMMEQYEKELTPAFDEMESITNVIKEIKSKKKPDGKNS